MDAKAISTVDLPPRHPGTGQVPARRLSRSLAAFKHSPRGIFEVSAGYLPTKATGEFGQYRRSMEAGAGFGRTLVENAEHLQSGVAPDTARVSLAAWSGAEAAERAIEWKPSSTENRSAHGTWKFAPAVAVIRSGAVSHFGGAEEMHGHADY